jgi:hypothetical protein
VDDFPLLGFLQVLDLNYLLSGEFLLQPVAVNGAGTVLLEHQLTACLANSDMRTEGEGAPKTGVLSHGTACVIDWSGLQLCCHHQLGVGVPEAVHR